MIIAGFPGVGKTTLEEKYPDHFKDYPVHLDDPSQWGDIGVVDQVHSEFIEAVSVESKHVFCLPTKAILDRLINAGLQFIVVVPRVADKDIYMKRYKKRGSDSVFLKLMDEHWEKWLEVIDQMKNLKVITLRGDDYLSSVIELDSKGELRCLVPLSPKYPTRKDVILANEKTSTREWDKWIMSLTIPADGNTKFVHLSFSDNLPSVVSPKPFVYFDDDSEMSEYDKLIWLEPLPMRVSMADSLLGCWGAIYPMVWDKFIIDCSDDIPSEFTLYLYEFTPEKGVRLLTPDILAHEWLVYDAHWTKETCAFGKVRTRLLERVTFKNDLESSSKELKVIPHNDLEYEPIFICTEPTIVKRVKG